MPLTPRRALKGLGRPDTPSAHELGEVTGPPVANRCNATSGAGRPKIHFGMCYPAHPWANGRGAQITRVGGL